MGSLDPQETINVVNNVNLIIIGNKQYTTFDDTYNKSSIASSTTVSLHIYSGTGVAQVVINGDGDSDVQILYSVDGGADLSAGTSDQTNQFPVAFQTSLEIKAKNNNSTINKNKSTIGVTGAKVS